MKICHISDLHWRGISRHKEYTDAFERLFVLLEANRPDIIVNCGDTFHTKTQGITPEIIERLSWMFRKLADIAPTYTLLGNHDGNLTNLHRQDIITPIHSAINHPHAYLLRKSEIHAVNDHNRSWQEANGKNSFHLCAFSPFDKKNWNKVKPVKEENAISIALYHGSVAGSEMDNNWRLPAEIAESDIAEFTEFDFALLGDIHKQQWVSRRFDKNEKSKPWMAYPGSLIQQNFGESETKGFLMWDIRSKDDWDVKFHELENRFPFVTINWGGSVVETLKNVEKTRGVEAFMPGSRFRVSSSQNIPSIEARKLLHELKEVRNAQEVTFKVDLVSRLEHVSTNNLKISKKGLRQDPDAVSRLYLDYISAHATNYKFIKEQLDEAGALIHGYMSQLMHKNGDDLVADANWQIKSLEFDNLFGYGEGNRIDFTKLDGITGIFGPNRIGKSSIVGALMYTLYNTTDRGSMKNAHIINTRKAYCKGTIRFSVGGDDYIVERQTARVIPKRKTKSKYSGRTTTTVNLFKIGWDELHGCEKKIDSNSISRDETDKVIRRLIGTKDDFLLTAFSSQGNIDKFIKEKATERKNILSRFLELDIFKQLEELVKRDYNAVVHKSSMLSPESLLNQIKKARKSITSIEQNIMQLDDKLTKQRQMKDEVGLWLMHHEKNAAEVDLAYLNELEKLIASKKDELTQKQIKLKESQSVYKHKQKRLADVKALKKKIDITELRNQIDDLEAVKSTLHELRHELAAQKGKLDTQKKNVRKLDLVPCGDKFPECYFIKDAHQDRNKIGKQETLVDTLTSQVEAHQSKLEEYIQKKIRETISNWQKLDREEFDLSTKLESAMQDKNYLQEEIKTCKKEIKATGDKLKSLRMKVNVLEGKEYESKTGQLKKIRVRIQSYENTRHEYLVNLGGKKESLSRLLFEQEETRALIEKLKIYDSIQSAFSKTGIPAMVLMSQLPAINQELEKILGGIVDFEIALETDTSSNVMDVFIVDENGKRIIELASGMEKTIASMALRVALINLSSLPKSDILIIDEPFGPLDQESLQGAGLLLSQLTGYFKTILIISHVQEIKEMANVFIDIESSDLGSKILYPPTKQ